MRPAQQRKLLIGLAHGSLMSQLPNAEAYRDLA